MWPLDSCPLPDLNPLSPVDGAVAQLGERVVRNDEVSGSIPLSSTISPAFQTESKSSKRSRSVCRAWPGCCRAAGAGIGLQAPLPRFARRLPHAPGRLMSAGASGLRSFTARIGLLATRRVEPTSAFPMSRGFRCSGCQRQGLGLATNRRRKAAGPPQTPLQPTSLQRDPQRRQIHLKRHRPDCCAPGLS